MVTCACFSLLLLWLLHFASFIVRDLQIRNSTGTYKRRKHTQITLKINATTKIKNRERTNPIFLPVEDTEECRLKYPIIFNTYKYACIYFNNKLQSLQTSINTKTQMKGFFVLCCIVKKKDSRFIKSVVKDTLKCKHCAIVNISIQLMKLQRTKLQDKGDHVCLYLSKTIIFPFFFNSTLVI